MTRSSGSPGFLPIVSGFIILTSNWTPALETVTIGQGGQLDWHGEGVAPVETIEALHRSFFDLNDLVQGNAPGNQLEFQSKDFPNSIHLLNIEEGKNIAAGTIDRGGSISSPNVTVEHDNPYGLSGSIASINSTLRELLSDEEGGETAAFERKNFNGFGIILLLDLGGRFGVDRIRFYPRNSPIQRSPTTPFEDDYMRAFELFTNDGVNLTKLGNPIWQPLIVEKDNENPVVEVQLDPPRIVQHIRMRSITTISWEIDEIEIFGRGFLTTARYISDIFDAGQPAAWTNLRWAEEIVGDPKFSNLDIRTRTGTDVSPFVFTRMLRGQRNPEEIPYALNSLTEEMDLVEYQSLPRADDAGRDWVPGLIRDDLVNWSPFSSPYPEEAVNGPGIPIISPSPRRYFQFQVIFTSTDLDAARVLNALSFDFATPPLADALKGEIFPRQVEVSQTLPFTFAVQAIMQTPGLTGFDTIEIPTPARVERIEAIQLWDGDGQLLAEREFTSLEDTIAINGFKIVSVEENRFTLRFPLVRENNTRVQVRFATEVLSYSTDFAASIRLAGEQAAFQTVTPGNVASLGADDDPDFSGTTVLSPSVLEGGHLLDKVELAPNPFTPNGDGRNDQLFVRYNLLSLSAPRPVKIGVYDLSGRLMRVVYDAPEGTGRYRDKSWDGRDDQGRLLAPGLYIVRIEVNGDAADAEQSQVIALAY